MTAYEILVGHPKVTIASSGSNSSAPLSPSQGKDSGSHTPSPVGASEKEDSKP